MHQVVAGSGGNTIDLALFSMGINEEYIKVSVPRKHSTKALNTNSNSWKILPRTPHITKIVAANQLIIIKMKIHSSCEIEDFIETHLCKLCVILRSRVLRVVCPH